MLYHFHLCHFFSSEDQYTSYVRIYWPALLLTIISFSLSLEYFKVKKAFPIINQICIIVLVVYANVQ